MDDSWVDGEKLTETIKNHYSPRFANRLWANKNGSIVKYALSPITGLSRERTGPTEWGQETNLYPQELENAFAKIESIIAPIYRLLLGNQILNLNQRLLWSHWILCQYSRTPSFIIDFAKIDEELFAKIPGYGQFSTKIDTEEKLQMALGSIANFASSKELVPFLAVRDWVICDAAPGCCFIRTDAPVVIAGPLVREKTQILYPLSPRKCFLATIIGRFPPSASLVHHQLTRERNINALRLIASRADREAIVHPDDDSEQLRSLLSDTLGVSSGYFTIGDIPDMRRE